MTKYLCGPFIAAPPDATPETGVGSNPVNINFFTTEYDSGISWIGSRRVSSGSYIY